MIRNLLKSLFLFLFLLTSAGLSAQFSQDFSKNEVVDGKAWLPTAASTTEMTCKSPSGKEWKITNVKSYGSYLMINSKGIMVLPQVDYALSSITVTSSKGGSTSASLSLYEGATLIETKKLSAVNTDFTFAIPSPKANAVYKFVNESSKNAQIVYLEAEKQQAGAFITTNETELSFVTVKNGTQKHTLNVIGQDLTEEIQLSIVGDIASSFSVTPSTLPATGGEVEITYTGLTAGANQTALNITSGATTASVDLRSTTFEGEGTQQNPFSISEVYVINNALEGKYWVRGTMAGTAITVNASTAPTGLNKEITVFNMALSSTMESIVMPVELPEGAIRTALNLVDHSDYLGKDVLVYGNLVSYFGRAGVKGVTDYKLLETTGSEENAASKNIVFNENGVLVVKAAYATTVEIFDVTGAKVASEQAQAGVALRFADLQSKAIYLVKIGNRVEKVIL